MPEKMPQIVPGMVIQYSDFAEDVNHGIVVYSNDQTVFCHEYVAEDGELLLRGAQRVSLENIDAVYEDIGGPALSNNSLYEIVTGHGRTWLIWKRSPAVREMTIKQIEEELGYPIKVVKG